MHVDLTLGRREARPRRSGRQGGGARLLADVLALAGPGAELLRHAERPWASVTFSGTRHAIVLAFRGGAAVAGAEDYIAALPDHEFAIPRHLVADAAISEVIHENSAEPKLTVEAEFLLLEEA